MNEVLSLDDIKLGGKRALSEALALAEQSFDAPFLISLMDEAYNNPRAHVVGFTGPPGVGKSTLINALIKVWRQQDKTVGVIAIDPSSQKSGGALLGDRTRMMTDPDDQGVFVRSLASRGQLGGVSELTFPVLVLMRSLFDIVVIETVGVGQSEADITSHADSIVLCIQPGSGDSLQFMKSGIMEIPDIAVVTKSDMGAAASRALSDLKGALSLTSAAAEKDVLDVLKVSAGKEEGLLELVEAIGRHFSQLKDHSSLTPLREQQAKNWLKARVCRDYGLKGYALVQNEIDSSGPVPFRTQSDLSRRLSTRLNN